MTSTGPRTFNLADPPSRRLFELLADAYGGVDGVGRLVLLAELSGQPTQAVNFNQSLDLALSGLLKAAARDGRLAVLISTAAEQNAAYRDEFLELQTAGPPRRTSVATVAGAEQAWDEVVPALTEAGRSRSPVLIALESADEPLEDAGLLRTERHLTVTLNPYRIGAIRRIMAIVTDGAGLLVDDIVDAGFQVWSELVGAEPRLKTLLERVAEAGLAQPVAWCGRSALLAELQLAVLIAHTGDGGAEGFVSVGGGHYFMPADAGRERTMRNRSRSPTPALRRVDLAPDGGALPQSVEGSEMVLLVGQADVASALRELTDRVRADAESPTRAVLAFGGGPADAQLVNDVLEHLPFLSLAPTGSVISAPPAGPDAGSGTAPGLPVGPDAGDGTAPGVVTAVRRALRRHAGRRALPCVVAAARAAWVRRAMAERDPVDCLRGLAWSTWSWIGLPLFPARYDELAPAAYPHLMDLRSVASEDWYFNRRQGIPDDYAADTLAGEIPPGQRFHLYLSGSGGTGKSCFLRYVHDQLAALPTTIAVWYRVDAPNSLWQNIEERLREETLEAIEHKFGAEAVASVAQLPARLKLGVFLNDAGARLRALDPAFDQIVVFIDQLERTFESGDEPDFARLDTISGDLVQLLKTVGVGQGVRVFVASRKQYLPDFLRSSRTAQACGLEFNVLQSIEDSRERVEFIQRVISWCQRQQLVAPNLVLQPEAKARLAERAGGHPLNMMLSLIQLLSARPGGEISAADLNDLRPWENLFALDLKAAERDDLDWHFLLAMAHARTEIVRFEEIWWRLRMVDPELTRRAEELGPEGILERLWLFGYLGRTVYVRPHAGHPARFVEFFHANLRDHLLWNVMARGGSDVEVRRRRRGTPPAWRALDRLAGYARDWEQTRQLLPAEDVRVLMEHRQHVIERVIPWGESELPQFHLLFLREADQDVRDELSCAARQCFAFSALVHDDLGRQTFAAVFPDVDERVRLCKGWLPGCSSESRPAVLAYLIETEAPSARRLLIELVLHGQGSNADATAQEIAALLAEPLYAARYRDALIAALLRAGLIQARGATARLPGQLKAFVLAACGGELTALMRVLDYCGGLLGGDADAAVREGAPALGRAELVESWLGGAGPLAGYAGTRSVERTALPAGAVLALVVGEKLRRSIDDAQLAAWSHGLRDRLGVPLPALRLLRGECEPNELELRSPRGRIAANLFHSGQVCVEQRPWESFARSTPQTALDTSDLTSGGGVIWLKPEVVARAGYPHPARTFDDAVLDWLVDHCRQSFELLMNNELLQHIVREEAATAAGLARVRRAGLVRLSQVIIDLVEEGVPFGPRRTALIDELAWLSDKQPPEMLTQKLREFLQAEICRQVADESGQVTTLLLDEQLEQALVDRVALQRGRRALALEPAQAAQVNAAVVRGIERVLAEQVHLPHVLVTDPTLRYALARMLWQFKTRLPVLGYNELDLDVLIPVPGALISAPGLRLKGRP